MSTPALVVVGAFVVAILLVPPLILHLKPDSAHDYRLRSAINGALIGLVMLAVGIHGLASSRVAAGLLALIASAGFLWIAVDAARATARHRRDGSPLDERKQDE